LPLVGARLDYNGFAMRRIHYCYLLGLSVDPCASVATNSIAYSNVANPLICNKVCVRTRQPVEKRKEVKKLAEMQISQRHRAESKNDDQSICKVYTETGGLLDSVALSSRYRKACCERTEHEENFRRSYRRRIERLMSQSCYTVWPCCVQQATSRNITVNETIIFSFHDQEWRIH
jgi:hypothetical protein